MSMLDPYDASHQDVQQSNGTMNGFNTIEPGEQTYQQAEAGHEQDVHGAQHALEEGAAIGAGLYLWNRSRQSQQPQYGTQAQADAIRRRQAISKLVVMLVIVAIVVTAYALGSTA
jgi:hypothetical protein